MISRIFGILLFSSIAASCAYKKPVELKAMAAESLDSAKKSKFEYPSLDEAEALFQFAEESDEKKEYGAATRAYKDIIAMLQKQNPEEDEKSIFTETKAYIEPKKFRQPRVPTVKKKESRFPDARNISDLKKEGIADLSKVKPSDEAKQRETALLFKEKFPGVIAYSFGEAEFQTSSLNTLEKIFINLKGDPKSTIMFQAQMGQGEEFALMDERFEILKTFFQEKGIDLGRIALDDKRIAGDWPEIRIFILH